MFNYEYSFSIFTIFFKIKKQFVSLLLIIFFPFVMYLK